MIEPLHRQAFSRCDARYYQIAALLLLLLYGLVRLNFDISLFRAIVILATVLFAQYCCHAWKLPMNLPPGNVSPLSPFPPLRRERVGVRGPFFRRGSWEQCASKLRRTLTRFDAKSALISGLSLCLLLRTNSLILATATAAVTIASKFVLRWNGKHIFNPTNFGLVFMMLCSDRAVWVSPGQWGDFAFFAFLVICLGGLVVNRAARVDVTLAFLVSWLALIFGRSFWLGEPIAIPLHRLQNGALLVFAFFMISDPKTTPDSRAGRIIFALMVAFGAAFVQFKLFRTNGLLWSLATLSVAVPLIDRLLPGHRYQWHRPTIALVPEKKRKTMKGNAYEPIPA